MPLLTDPRTPDEAMAFMRFLNSTEVARFTVRVSEDTSWGDIIDDIGRELDTLTAGDVLVMLGREDSEHFTDIYCEIGVRYKNPDDLPVIQEVLQKYVV